MIFYEDRKKVIGQRIKEERKNIPGMTQERFLKKLCMSERSTKTLRAWENGDMLPTLDNLAQMADLFDCDIGYLLGDYPERRRDSADVCRLTGISEDAVNKLVGVRFKRLHLAAVLSRLIEQPEFEELLLALGRCETLYNHDVEYKQLLDVHVALLKETNKYSESKQRHFDGEYKLIVPSEETIHKYGVVYEPQHIMAMIAERCVDRSREEVLNNAVDQTENQ